MTTSRQAQHEQQRRIGFVLERHCSLSRHHLSLHARGSALLETRIGPWQEVAASRDALPPDATPLPSFQRNGEIKVRKPLAKTSDLIRYLPVQWMIFLFHPLDD